MAPVPRSALVRSSIAIGGVAAVAAAQYATWPLLSATPYQLFYLLLIVVAWNLGTVPGLIAAGLSLLVVDFLFLPPIGELGLNTDAIAPTVVAALATLVTARLGRSSRSAREETVRLLETETRLRGQAERSAERTARLQAITSAFSEALTVADVASVLTERGLPLLHAASGSLGLVSGSGDTIELVSVAGPRDATAPTTRLRIDAAVPLADAARTRRPIFVDELPDPATDAGLPAAAGPPHQGGYVAIPLVAHRRLIGVVDMTFDGEVGREDRQLILALAHQCAQALDRALLYEDNARLYEDAQAANRAKDDFLATVSHEVRTPLNAILGWSQILREPGLDDETTQHAVEAIERSAQSQARIIADILDVSRVIAGKLSLDTASLDIERVIRSAHDALAPEAEAAGVAVALELGADLPTIEGDFGRMEQVLCNLLGNAIRHTPRGGHVTVRAGVRDRDLVIEVIDDGSGIDPALLPHLFERYRQGSSDDGQSGSLGIGLSIARSIVQLHGGSVDAASDGPGCGACFSVRLPVASRSMPVSQDEKPPPAGVPGEKPLAGVRVLAVDDNPDARVLVETILRRAGAAVVVTDSAERAVELARTWRPHVIVSDIAMPGSDGYDLLRTLQAAGGEVAPPVIAVTAFARAEDRQRALDAGFADHIGKPVEAERLVAAVRDRARSVTPT